MSVLPTASSAVRQPSALTAASLMTKAAVSVAKFFEKERPLSGTSVITFTLFGGGDPAGYVVQGVPGTIDLSGPIVFTSDVLPDSTTYLLYVSDLSGCGTVQLVVQPCHYEPEVFVPESFTPNGDGINDEFLIPGLEDFPGNQIHIFNRWGDQVYAATDYDQQWKRWDGTAQNSALSGDLPTGTYYYVLELGNGRDAVKGFIYLNR